MQFARLLQMEQMTEVKAPEVGKCSKVHRVALLEYNPETENIRVTCKTFDQTTGLYIQEFHRTGVEPEPDRWEIVEFLKQYIQLGTINHRLLP